MADEAKLIAVVEANTRQIENSMKQLTRLVKGSTDQMTTSVKKLDQQVGLVAGSFNKLGKAFTVTAAIATAKQLASTFADVAAKAGDLADAADKIGISTKSLQELRYAAKQSGIDIGELDGALSKLSKGLAEARTGSGDLRKLLLANGMSEAQIKALSLEQALAKVADLVKNAKDATDAGKISTLAFGKSMDELVNMLRDGKIGLDEFRKAANDTGQVLGDEGVRKLAAYDDKLQELTGRWHVAVDNMTLWALTALTEIGRVEHAAADAIAAEVARVTTVPGAAQGAAAGAQVARGPAGRIARVPPAPAVPTGTAAAVAAAAARARAAAAVPAIVPPSVVPSSGGGSSGGAGGGGGGGGGGRTGPSMTSITTKGGLTATVDARYAAQFEGLLNDLEERITIKGLSSLRPGATVAGTGRPSQHRYGKAIDVDPSMNVGTWRSGGFSDAELRSIAARWGMRWGGDFRKRDTMHFDVMGKAPMGEETLNTAKGLSNEAQTLAENTQKAADAAKAYDDAAKSAQDAITNANQAFKRDLLGGFIRDLEHGVKPAEALANALQKISDRLLDMGLNAIFPDVGSGILGAVMAGGGVMTSRGPMPLRKYAGGGVAHSPQMAVFGEGAGAEAFVPLPDGRRIPVNIRVPGMGGLGGGRGGQAVAVHNRVTVEPSPLFVVTTHEVARQAGHAAVAEAGDASRRRPGGR